MSDVPQNILYGGTSHILEIDPEENDEMSAEAQDQYIRYAISETIGTDEFEETFLSLGNDLLAQSIDGLKDAYTAMAEKVYEVYEYEHPEDIQISDENELRNYIDFVKFIEYDNIDFISVIWYEILGQQEDLVKLDIPEFCMNNKNEITSLIENEIESYTYNNIITKFLIYYPSNYLIEWFINQSEKSRFDILFNNLKGRI